ncbi:DUF4406 domain-containing protein [Treponema sp.]|uniref:DUF4406 domain-containing protein n=1 Tax=Treponema sp. TaxID=166 RepID=UPI003FD8DA9C
MKVYISGKMTGLSKRKIIRKFRLTENKLVKKGFSVLNPAIFYYLKNIDFFSYADFLQIDYRMIDRCDAIYLQKDWKTSKGARLELAYAEHKKKIIMYED